MYTVPPESGSVPLAKSIIHSSIRKYELGTYFAVGMNKVQNSVWALPLQSLLLSWRDNQITTQVCVK